jgi:hypothetical protein
VGEALADPFVGSHCGTDQESVGRVGKKGPPGHAIRRRTGKPRPHEEFCRPDVIGVGDVDAADRADLSPVAAAV